MEPGGREMRAVIIIGAALALSACSTVTVDRPCGVIIDSLRDVQGATPAMTRRIDIHVERGIAAGCWPRQAPVVMITGGSV
jgi:hypothetical protein